MGRVNYASTLCREHVQDAVAFSEFSVYRSSVRMREKRDVGQGHDIDDRENEDDETLEVPNEYESYRNALIARNLAYMQPALQSAKLL